MATAYCFLMATTAQGTISPWLNNPQQLNRFFLARPLPSENNFQLDNDYDARLMEEIPTEMAINGPLIDPEARAPGRLNRLSTFLSTGNITPKFQTLQEETNETCGQPRPIGEGQPSPAKSFGLTSTQRWNSKL
jgi:hypothetical protein